MDRFTLLMTRRIAVAVAALAVAAVCGPGPVVARSAVAGQVQFMPPVLGPTLPGSIVELAGAADSGANEISVTRPARGEAVWFEHPFGAPWTTPSAVPGGGAGIGFHVAAAGAGAAAIVWEQREGPFAGGLVAAVRDPGDVLRGPVPIAPVRPIPSMARRGLAPVVAVDAHGDVAVAVLHGTAQALKHSRAGIVLITRRAGQAVFDSPVIVTRSAASAPSLAMNAHGDGVLAWRSRNQIKVLALIAARPAQTSAIGRVTGRARVALAQPTVAVGAQGDAVIAWWSGTARAGGRVGRSALMASVRRTGPRFARANVLERAGSLDFDRTPHAVIAPNGTVAVAWAAQHTGSRIAFAATGANRFTAMRTLPRVAHLAALTAAADRIMFLNIEYGAPRRGIWLGIVDARTGRLGADRIARFPTSAQVLDGALHAGLGGRLTALWAERSNSTLDAPTRLWAADASLPG